jgi:hypothetical protein
MLQRLWQNGDFVAIHVTDGRIIRSRSLLLYMPVILGTRLPASVQTMLLANLRKRASESSFGLASEPESSPLYVSDGYWRGPVWAPSTMIIATALDEMGEHTFSDSLKMRFCMTAGSVQTSNGGKAYGASGAHNSAAAGQTASGNKYAAANGNVYKNTGSGWNQTQGTPKSTSSYSGTNSAAARGYGGQEKSSGASAFSGGGSGGGWQSRQASARGSASRGGGGRR